MGTSTSKLSQRWTRENVEAMRAKLQQEMAPYQKDPKAEFRWINSRLAEASKEITPLAQLECLLLCFRVLHHQACYGSSTQSEVRGLIHTAEGLLRMQGVDPVKSSLAYLHHELASLTGQILRRDGQLWDAAWQHSVAAQIIDVAPDQVAWQGVAFGLSALRLGIGDLAEECLEAAELSQPSTVALETVRLSRIRQKRLARDFKGARTLLRATKLVEECSARLLAELCFEEMKIELFESGDPTKLVKAFKQEKTRWPLEYCLETWLWARTVKTRTHETTLGKVRALKRPGDLPLGAQDPLLPLYRATQKVEELYDKNRPLRVRLDNIAQALARSDRLTTIDHELLLLAAAGRSLLRIKQTGPAAFVFARYRQLCRSLSSGLHTDVMNTFGNTQLPPPIRAAIKAKGNPNDQESPLTQDSVRTQWLARTWGLGKMAIEKGQKQAPAPDLSISPRQQVLQGRPQPALIRSTERSETIKDLICELNDLKGVMAKLARLAGVSPKSTKSLEIDSACLGEILKGSLGEKYALLEEVDSDAYARGSVAQVHRATHTNGTDLAIKVRYPQILKSINEDFQHLKTGVYSVRKIFPQLDVVGVFNEAHRLCTNELNLQKEMDSIQKFRVAAQGLDGLHVPHTFADLTCETVLTMKFEAGYPLDEVVNELSQEEKNHLGQLIFRFVYQSMYMNQISTADLDPSNILISGDGVTIVDFGNVIDWKEHGSFAAFDMALKIAAVNNDLDGFRDAFLAMGYVNDSKAFDFNNAMEMQRRTRVAPLLVDHFRFDKGHHDRAADLWDQSQNHNISNHQIQISGWHRARVHLSLNRILALLQAEGPFRDIFFEIADLTSGEGQEEPYEAS